MPSAIQTQPDHARLIGMVTAEWSLVELMLSSLFSTLLDTDYARAHAVFFSFQSHRAQFEVVKAVGAVALAEQPDRLVELKQLLSRIETVARRRNDFAHGLWGVCPTTGVVRLINMGKPHRGLDEVRLSDLHAVADEIASIVEDLHRLHARLAGFEHLLETGR
jgi:hypothetical protein